MSEISQVAFPYLEELILDGSRIIEIWQEQFPVESFCRLRVQSICEYRDILVVIPSSMLQRLHKLEKLTVRSRGSVKEVVQLEGLVDEENHFRALARLRELELNDLPELKYLWKENSNVGPHFQNLEILKIWDCDNLMNLVPSSVSFHNLASLDISYCCSLINLLPPLIAKSLVQHKIFKIGRSDMMKEVVANEGENAGDEITFCKLEEMELCGLPNLTSFCSGVYSLSFPVLERVVVEECPKMKIFSQGLLVTPRLDRVEVGNNKEHWKDDLNTTIHLLFNTWYVLIHQSSLCPLTFMVILFVVQ